MELKDIADEIMFKQIEQGYVDEKSGRLKYLPVKEMRELGLISEINRQVLHPLGFALEVQVDASGDAYISGVWDCRDDPEGIAYEGSQMVEAVNRNAATYAKMWDERWNARVEALGYMIQPVLPSEPKRDAND